MELNFPKMRMHYASSKLKVPGMCITIHMALDNFEKEKKIV